MGEGPRAPTGAGRELGEVMVQQIPRPPRLSQDEVESRTSFTVHVAVIQVSPDPDTHARVTFETMNHTTKDMSLIGAIDRAIGVLNLERAAAVRRLPPDTTTFASGGIIKGSQP